MATGYLLDTNVLRYWFDDGRPEHDAVTRRIASLPEASPLAISAITLGEVEYGHRALGSYGDPAEEAQFNDFISSRLPTVLNVGKHTRGPYGLLRALLFERFAPKDRRKKGLRPEELLDPTSGKELGIQENDLWIAAQALELNLVLVTNDKMQRLREVGTELRIESWATPTRTAR
ncbi:MAG TPA: PIN domain-containing protein [Thermoanaerobaculia bacterium]|nr:PIN domain-containing protein [Thermoanaerobaculia bacterium]